ncbi:MAG: DUF2878 domain-containing protein [Planctomycetota bacterium]|jgi:hypothetical protein
MSRATRLKVIDFVLLQVGWAACVFGAAAGHAWLGPIGVAVIVALHLALSPHAMRDLLTAAAISVPGVLADSAQVALGVVAFPEGPQLGVLPVWIVALWPLFGSTFHSVLGWLHHRLPLAAALGAVGGPPGYFAAERLGALELPHTAAVSFASLALAWACVMPLGLWIARRFAGHDPGTLPGTETAVGP